MIIYMYRYDPEIQGKERRVLEEKAEMSLLEKAYSSIYGRKMPELIRDERGKPMLKDDRCRISLSHTAGLILTALSENNIGIDCEKIRKYPERVADRCFSENEKKALESSGSRDREFFIIWTMKEAALKLDGTGLRFPLSEVSTFRENTGIRVFTYDGYVISAMEEGMPRAEIRIFEGDV
jgi:phosphopantetheine--protein transferase-like protein